MFQFSTPSPPFASRPSRPSPCSARLLLSRTQACFSSSPGSVAPALDSRSGISRSDSHIQVNGCCTCQFFLQSRFNQRTSKSILILLSCIRVELVLQIFFALVIWLCNLWFCGLWFYEEFPVPIFHMSTIIMIVLYCVRRMVLIFVMQIIHYLVLVPICDYVELIQYVNSPWLHSNP